MTGENVGSIEYDARISTKKLRADAAEANRLAKNTGDSIGSNVDKGSGRAARSLKKFAKIATIALAAVTAGAIAFGVKSVKAYSESENAIAQTNAVLKSTKGAAGVSAKAVTDLANSLQRQTRYSDETIRSAENMLLTFTNIGKDVFPAATNAVLDMATAMHEDLQTSSIRLGKALQDPVKGVTALQKVGVKLSDSQKELVKHLVAVGDKAGAQRVILKELQTEFGGSAKAAGQTFAGRLDILKNQLGEVQEGIGLLILKGITPLVSGFVNLFDKAGGAEGIIRSVKATMDSVIPTLQQWWSNITAVATQIGNYLGPKLTALWTTISTQVLPILSQLWHNVLAPLIPVIGTVLVVALGLAIDAFNAILHAITWVITALKNGNPIIWLMVGALGGLAAALAITRLISAVSAAFNFLSGVAIPRAIAKVGAMRALVLSPMVMPAIAVGAALAAIGLVYNKIKQTQALLDSVNEHIVANNAADTQQMRDVIAAYKAGKISKKQYQNFFKSITQRASGGPVSANTPYIVGEKRPELFVPRTAGTIIPEVPSWRGGSAGNTNVTINMKGIMSRSINDEREIARSLIKRLNDELNAKGIQLIGGGAI